MLLINVVIQLDESIINILALRDLGLTYAEWKGKWPIPEPDHPCIVEGVQTIKRISYLRNLHATIKCLPRDHEWTAPPPLETSPRAHTLMYTPALLIPHVAPLLTGAAKLTFT